MSETIVKYPIPTGYLFVDQYEKGPLETLSIGDYGKPANVMAKFLGLDDEIHGVDNQPCMPLQEKWVVTLSTQHGCPMRCTFCDVPNVRFKGNVPFGDLLRQLESAIDLFPSVGYTERLNIHFARMGDPIFNEDVLTFAEYLYDQKGDFQDRSGLRAEVIHPVLTTSLPKRLRGLEERLRRWCDIKNDLYRGQAGLQFSINSTNDAQREVMFGGMSLKLSDFAALAARLPDPISRKYCLNFAYSTDFEVDAEVLTSMFDQEKFMVKITPIHNNNACEQNGIETVGGYESWAPYRKPEEELRAMGWDVLVFVPSLDEEQGLVTCGNAVLGGSVMRSDSVINIRGLV